MDLRSYLLDDELHYDPFDLQEHFFPDALMMHPDASFNQLWIPFENLATTSQQLDNDGFDEGNVFCRDASFETRGIGSCLLDTTWRGFYFDSWPSTPEAVWQHEQFEVSPSTKALGVSLFLGGSEEEALRCDTDWLPQSVPRIERETHSTAPRLESSIGRAFRCKGHQHRIQKKKSPKHEQPYKASPAAESLVDGLMQRASRTVKGLTMCMRTLLRQLLAGTGWIVDASICRDKAICLIKILIGRELEDRVCIDLPTGDTSHLPTGWKERHYTAILASKMPLKFSWVICPVAEILSYHMGIAITIGDLEDYIMLRRGPYRLSDRFKDVLGDKQWPPYMPPEDELRAYGCYRFGEAATRRSDATMHPNFVSLSPQPFSIS